MKFENTKDYFWQSDQIRLRPMQSSDWEMRYQESTDTEGYRLMNSTVQIPRSVDLEKECLENWVNYKDSDKLMMFTIETLDGEVAGGANIYGRSSKNGTFTIGMRIYRDFRKRGYAEDAMRILLRYCFYELRMQKCNSGCIDFNNASIALHKKIGFIKEGCIRRSIYTDGKFHDDLLFGLTREEFVENENKLKETK